MAQYDLIKVSFRYDGEEHLAEAVEEDGKVVINFDGTWYRTTDDFFAKASIDGLRLVVIGGEPVKIRMFQTKNTRYKGFIPN